MSELELVRDLVGPDLPADPDARARVRAAVAARTYERRRRSPIRLAVPAVAVLAAAATAAILLTGGGGRTENAAAARVLRQAATVAQAGRSLTTLGPGQYLYTRSADEYLNTYALKSGSFAFMVPYSREIWLRRDGTGWLHQTSG